ERPADRPDIREVSEVVERVARGALASSTLGLRDALARPAPQTFDLTLGLRDAPGSAPIPPDQRWGLRPGEPGSAPIPPHHLRRVVAPALLVLCLASLGVGLAWWNKGVAGSAEEVRTAPLSIQPLPSEAPASPAPSGGDSLLPAGVAPINRVP